MIEALFFKTYYSYLTGNLSDTTMFFSFLLEEFNKKKNPDALTKRQLLELKKIRSALNNNKIETSPWINETDIDTVSTSENPDIKQTVLVKLIHFKGIETLRRLLNSKNLELHNIEHACGNYGFVDMVYRDPDIYYPIEVKRHEGKHDLIGQISKYNLFFKLHLHLKHYKEVQPVTICNSYNPHTLTELKRISVIPLKYALIDDEIKIVKV